MSLHGLFGAAWPLMHVTVVGLVAMAAARLVNLAGHAAASIRDRRIREWVETLVRAAEQAATSDTGRKQWVLDHLKKLFPTLPSEVATALIDGAFKGMTQAMSQ